LEFYFRSQVSAFRFYAIGVVKKAQGQPIYLSPTVFHFTLVLGVSVVAIAQVMEFGHEIEQEKDSFI